MTRLYAWAPDRKANKALIVHHIAKAVKTRESYRAHDAASLGKMCSYMVDVINRDKNKSIKQLARESLEYHRLRAFLGLRANDAKLYAGWPWDKPSHDSWNEMQVAK